MKLTPTEEKIIGLYRRMLEERGQEGFTVAVRGIPHNETVITQVAVAEPLPATALSGKMHGLLRDLQEGVNQNRAIRYLVEYEPPGLLRVFTFSGR